MSTQTSRAAYIAGILADWPPLTPQQQSVISKNLHGSDGVYVPSAGPSDYEIEQRRKEYERAEALKAAIKSAEELTACDVCNLQPDAHRIRKAMGSDMHEWTPGRAEKLMKRRIKP